MSNGLGSNNFVIWRDGLKLRGLNSSGAGGLEPGLLSPQAQQAGLQACFRRRQSDKMPVRGRGTDATPVAVAGWIARSENAITQELHKPPPERTTG